MTIDTTNITPYLRVGDAGDGPQPGQGGQVIVASLDRVAAHGYDCFYVGRRALVRLTGDGCWRHAYDERPPFANILCVRRALALAPALLAPFSLANPARFSPEALL